MKIDGKYNSIIVHTNKIDKSTAAQLKELSNQPFIENSKIIIMPDCHAGKGCVIGTTMTVKDKVCPNLVGVDIGCGLAVYKLKNKDIDLKKLDEYINKNIPSGFNVHDNIDQAVHLSKDEQSNDLQVEAAVVDFFKLLSIEEQLHDIADNIRANINKEYLFKSAGTLGGGNHFIEIDKDKQGNLYLVVHTGSRHLGVEVCEFYQKLAQKKLSSDEPKKKLIAELKAQGREKEIQSALMNLDKKSINKDLAYLQGDDLDNYLNDMKYAQKFAKLNRDLIAENIISGMKLETEDFFHTVHNYIDLDNNILRKGAISAQQLEHVIIPMNMSDGSLLCVGKGHPDWNFSAPHGAGRLMSRKQAKEQISLDEYKNSMKDIYTTSVCEATIDEAPQAYKSASEIMELINPTVYIMDVIKPVYNFKAKN